MACGTLKWNEYWVGCENNSSKKFKYCSIKTIHMNLQENKKNAIAFYKKAYERKPGEVVEQ